MRKLMNISLLEIETLENQAARRRQHNNAAALGIVGAIRKMTTDPHVIHELAIMAIAIPEGRDLSADALARYYEKAAEYLLVGASRIRAGWIVPL